MNRGKLSLIQYGLLGSEFKWGTYALLQGIATHLYPIIMQGEKSQVAIF